MKRIATLAIIALLLLALVACNGIEKTEYLIKLPSETEQVGYSITFTGTTSLSNYEEGKFWTYEGESLQFEIEADLLYTLDNLVVKDNGKKIVLSDVSDDYSQKVSFEIQNIKEAHTVTVEGVELISHQVKLFKPKYAEDENDKDGTIFTDYDDRYVVIRHENQMFYNINTAINAINAKNIKLGHNESLDLWVGEKFINSYTSTLGAYTATDDFDGIFGTKVGDSIENVAYSMRELEHVGFAFDENGQQITEGNLYKLGIVADRDINLYFDTLALAESKSDYQVKGAKCEVFEVIEDQDEYSYVNFDTRWGFSIDKKITDDSVNYDNMKVYVNGEDVTDDIDENGKFSFIGRPPSAFNPTAHTNYTEYEITVGGIVFEEDDFVGFKLNQPIGAESLALYIGYFYVNNDGISDYLGAYHYQDGYTYLRKSDKPYAHINVNGMYDHSNLNVTANGEPVVSTEYLEGASSLPYSYTYEIKFDEEYDNEIVIEIGNLPLKKVECKINNDLKSEIDMFLEYNGEEQLVTSEIALNLVHYDAFIIRLHSKNQGVTDISAYNIVGVEEDYIIASGEGKPAGTNIINSKEFHIQINAFLMESVSINVTN